MLLKKYHTNLLYTYRTSQALLYSVSYYENLFVFTILFIG